MTEGLTTELFAAAAFVALGGILTVRRLLGLRWGLAVVGVRVAIPLAFFAFLDTGAWRQLDDITYAEEAAELVATGTGPVGLLMEESSTEALFRVAGGRHVGYYAFNVLAQTLFGDHYWSAVFLNVLMTFFAARAFWWIVELLGFSRDYARAATIFFLLHWDVVAWSSFHNLKDALVMCLAVWLFACGLSFVKRPAIRTALCAAGFAFLLGFVRWYVPLLVLSVFGGWALFHLSGWKRVILIAGIVLGLVTQAPVALQREMIDPGGVVFGALRFAFTPRPWGLSASNSFLLVPSILHWFFAPVAIYGAVRLWSRSPLARTLVVYFLVVILFYALIPRLQGPRHRFMGVFALGLFQFHGLHAWVTHALGRRRRPFDMAVAPGFSPSPRESVA